LVQDSQRLSGFYGLVSANSTAVGVTPGYHFGALYVASNELESYAATGCNLIDSTALSTNTWYQADLVVNGSTETLYLNGTQVAGGSAAEPSLDQRHQLAVGAVYTSTWATSTLRVSGVGVPTALNATQIATNYDYSAGTAAAPTTLTATLTPNDQPVLSWTGSIAGAASYDIYRNGSSLASHPASAPPTQIPPPRWTTTTTTSRQPPLLAALSPPPPTRCISHLVHMRPSDR